MSAFACGGGASTPESSSKADRQSSEPGSSKESAAADPVNTSLTSSACCPADPEPGCCMRYGGWSEHGCADDYAICDGMPVPNDPGWKLEKDTHGCDTWTNPHGVWAGAYNENTDPNTDYCMAPPRDAGHD